MSTVEKILILVMGTMPLISLIIKELYNRRRYKAILSELTPGKKYLYAELEERLAVKQKQLKDGEK